VRDSDVDANQRSGVPSSTMKKLRGGRKYYERLRDDASTFSIDLRPAEWYDLWHHHFDRDGHSRKSGRARARHLSALFVAFRRVLRQTSEASRPVQVFLSIAPEWESNQDALYVHTPNPNRTPFPHSFEGVQWMVAPPSFLRPFVEGEPWDIGTIRVDRGAWWVIRPRLEHRV
jgi:hypothetical protein